MLLTNNFYAAKLFEPDSGYLPSTSAASNLRIMPLKTIKNSDGDSFSIYAPIGYCRTLIAKAMCATGGGYARTLKRSEVGSLIISHWPNVNADGSALFYFGTGTTPPTVNDIDLESPISPTFSGLNNTLTYLQVQNGKLKRTTVVHLTNSGSADVTFQEMGIAYALVANDCPATYNGNKVSTYTGSSGVVVLLARHVFDTPITIPYTESKTIAFTYETTIGSTTDFPDTTQTPGY